jgi:predicted cupin superfamily sugar epimerase
MGCFYELNDTLLLTKEQGFPSDVFDYKQHITDPVKLSDVKDKVFQFKGKPAARAFQLDPVRVYLFERTSNDKWLAWGEVLIQSLNIEHVKESHTPGNAIKFQPGDWITSGTFKILKIFDPEYQRIFTTNEAPEAWNFFAGHSKVRDQCLPTISPESANDRDETLAQIIARLGLQFHPIEGGYFRQTYVAAEGTLHTFLPQRFNGDRPFCSQIYYLLMPGRISAMHKMLADMTYHFYAGGPLEVVEITPDGDILTTVMGSDVTAGQTPQHTIMNGNWLGSSCLDKEAYALIGCSVAPAMSLDDYEHGMREDLLEKFPQHQDIIRKLTWDTKSPPPPYFSEDGKTVSHD